MAKTHLKAVMLRTNWPGQFGRSVFRTVDGKKEFVERLVFKPGEPVELTAEQIEAVQGDIGSALVEVEFDEKSRPRVVGPAPSSDEATLEALVSRQQEAIDLLVQQVKELGAEPVVTLEGAESDDVEKPTKGSRGRKK